MMKQCGLWALVPLSILATTVTAEVLRIPLGQQAAQQQHIDRPTLGMPQASVLQQYGEPQQRYAPVGDPPISRWQYRQFTVYFESDIVMHSVVRHQPKQEVTFDSFEE